MNNRLLLLIILFMALVGATKAQVSTMSAFSPGGSTEGSLFVVVGEPFTGSVSSSGYEISAGIAQAQLMQQNFEATVHFGEGYAENGFFYPTTTPQGTYHDKMYIPYGGGYNYDLLKTLILKITKPTCGELVYDGDHFEYPTVEVAGYCWTQKNLRTQHYTNGTTINKALVYNSFLFPDEVENESVYGRLYTWYSAVGVAENSTDAPTTDVNGYVQGACPTGWHIPTIVEFNALQTLSTEDLRSTELWLTPNSNTNSTGFSELPAGWYNANQNSFERMLMDANIWSTDVPSSEAATALSIAYYCDTPLSTTISAKDAVSVRCVKNH